MHPTVSGQVDLWPEWGTGANEIARGNHTHAKSQNGLYAINNSGSGDVTKATWLDGIYGTIEGGIELTTSSWNANQLQILARWGTGANQVARGNHTHTINGVHQNPHGQYDNDAENTAGNIFLRAVNDSKRHAGHHAHG